MGPSACQPVTEPPPRWRAGGRCCLNEPRPLKGAGLRRGWSDHRLLRTTALVNEAWPKLVDRAPGVCGGEHRGTAHLLLDAFGVAPNTVWSLAKVWLQREFSQSGAHAG